MNFALILLLALLLTFSAWLADRVHFRPRREAAARRALEEFDARAGSMTVGSAEALGEQREALRQKLERQPWWLEYTAGLFPVIAVVFALRSFVAEPFKIPSESMLPTLHVGDLILVNKYTYGIRLPVANTKVLSLGEPRRGDVMVFRFPSDPSIDYIKRVVGLPGDRISYRDNRLSVNGQPAALAEDGRFEDRRRLLLYPQWSETLGEQAHRILTDRSRPSQIAPTERFPFFDQCRYQDGGVDCTVPAGHYYVLGDNRENSLDSRFWGFVPEQNIVGKAFFIWMNFSDFSRIGAFR
jgi:signal peptidase I